MITIRNLPRHQAFIDAVCGRPLVARLAQRSAVAQLKSKVGELRKGLNVICVKSYSVALAGTVAAFLARPVITSEHHFSPLSVLGGVTDLKVHRRYATLPRRVSW